MNARPLELPAMRPVSGVESTSIRFFHTPAEDGSERPPPVIVAAAQFEVEQQGGVRHQIQTVCVHQRLTAQSVTHLETWGVDPPCGERRRSGAEVGGEFLQRQVHLAGASQSQQTRKQRCQRLHEDARALLVRLLVAQQFE
ncbi:hypothetical protein F7725_023634 [Dissostichus mawsoni]|uniref:Uncharacterized protein n=1 Tax=Dissostichus mawsoni TaxID=36200 RepID=A0A7J5XXX6_DISMA|nr:hypothetical protein F7725_023634 [Dissostichus mawsoni]